MMLGKTIPAPSGKRNLPPRTPSLAGHKRLVMIVAALAVVLCTWAIIRMVNGSSGVPAPVSEFATSPAAGSDKTATTSSNGAFSIVFPSGWSGILRVRGEDRFVLPGTGQPDTTGSSTASIRDVASTETGPNVFEAGIRSDYPPPQGEATDFMFGRGDSLLSGKKFVLSYGQDVPVESGPQRGSGDLDYTYVFALGGKDGRRELRVTYRVYGSDPRNNIGTVDGVVRSIRLLKQ